MKYDKLFVPTPNKPIPDDYVTGDGAYRWEETGRWVFVAEPLWLCNFIYRYGDAVIDYSSMTPEDLSAHRQALEAAEAEAKRKEDEGMEEAYELLAEIFDSYGFEKTAQDFKTKIYTNNSRKAGRLLRDKLKEARNND